MEKTICFFLLIFYFNVKAQDYLFVSNSSSGQVSKIDVSSNTEISELMVSGSVPTNSMDIAITNMVLDKIHNLVFISNTKDNAISVIDLNTFTTSGPIAVSGMGIMPIGIAINNSCSKLYVCTQGSSTSNGSTHRLDVIDIDATAFPPKLTLSGSVLTGKKPVTVKLSLDEKRAVVTSRDQARINIINLSTMKVEKKFDYASTYELEGMDRHPSKDIFYIFSHGKDQILILNLGSMSIVKTVALSSGSQPSGGSFSPDGNRIFVAGQSTGKVYVYNSSNPTNPSPLTSFATGSSPHHILFTDNNTAYVANTCMGQSIGNISFVANASSGTPTVSSSVSGVFEGPIHFVYMSQPSTATTVFTNTNFLEINEVNEIKLQNYPNPFNHSSTITFSLPKDEYVKLELYSLSGNLVRYIIDEKKTAGEYNFEINTASLPSGIYIYRLSTSEKTINSRCIKE